MKFMYKPVLILLAAILFGLSAQVGAQGVSRQEVADFLRDGQTAIAQKRFDDAIAKCQAGLDKLGNAYVRAAVDDDTGLKLVAADILRREGKTENASSMYCRMLAERLEQFVGK